jgi:uncharacterized protein YmfQ (DUF2313 family)
MSRKGSSVQAFFEAVGSQLPPNIPIQNKKNFKRKSKDKDSLYKQHNGLSRTTYILLLTN